MKQKVRLINGKIPVMGGDTINKISPYEIDITTLNTSTGFDLNLNRKNLDEKQINIQNNTIKEIIKEYSINTFGTDPSELIQDTSYEEDIKTLLNMYAEAAKGYELVFNNTDSVNTEILIYSRDCWIYNGKNYYRIYSPDSDESVYVPIPNLGENHLFIWVPTGKTFTIWMEHNDISDFFKYIKSPTLSTIRAETYEGTDEDDTDYGKHIHYLYNRLLDWSSLGMGACLNLIVTNSTMISDAPEGDCWVSPDDSMNIIIGKGVSSLSDIYNPTPIIPVIDFSGLVVNNNNYNDYYSQFSRLVINCLGTKKIVSDRTYGIKNFWSSIILMNTDDFVSSINILEDLKPTLSAYKCNVKLKSGIESSKIASWLDANSTVYKYKIYNNI